ncbi:hypothetical protein AAHA92_01584 [Salvia divinorum]|uniref:Uncharacterized protein n=1 Tax=Salvia divinorum TaxID=28513 RepID=A0ABD1IBX7_SALDI
MVSLTMREQILFMIGTRALQIEGAGVLTVRDESPPNPRARRCESHPNPRAGSSDSARASPLYSKSPVRRSRQ